MGQARSVLSLFAKSDLNRDSALASLPALYIRLDVSGRVVESLVVGGNNLVGSLREHT